LISGILSTFVLMATISAYLTMNYRVPENIAIVGLDNIPAAFWVRPQLSTVAQYPGEKGYVCKIEI
jgi:LacI family transcriptional regulator/LacI family repressor for deo operon, udp, cdd, tsx, nupC, and nupG